MIHASAVIDSQAELADDVQVGPHAVIEGPVRVGRGTKIMANAYLCGHTTMGEQCEVYPGAVVGHVPQDRAYAGKRSYCVIGDRTIIREGATVHRGTGEETSTVIGNDCMLLAGSHVGHNCRLGDRVVLSNCSLLAGYVVVGAGAYLSGLVAVHQFVRIGELVMIAGSARTSMDVPPFFICAGDSTCAAVNLVGMRRAGMSPEQIRDVKGAFRTLYRSGSPFRQAVERLGETVSTDAGRRIYEFVSAETQRGYCAGARRRTSTLVHGAVAEVIQDDSPRNEES